MLKHINSQNFEKEVLQSEKAILVDFFATWCGPCQMLGTVLERIGDSRAEFDIAKINIDEARDLAEKYNINAVPTMLVLKNGEVVDSIQGFVEEEIIVNAMAKYI